MLAVDHEEGQMYLSSTVGTYWKQESQRREIAGTNQAAHENLVCLILNHDWEDGSPRPSRVTTSEPQSPPLRYVLKYIPLGA